MSVLTVVNICNVALGNIGISRQISALTDNNKDAKACNLYYEHCRNECLESAPWGPAKKRYTLAETANDPPDEWGYEYEWPSGMVLPIEITDGLTIRRRDQEIPFSIGYDSVGDARVIHTNQEDAVLVGVEAVTNPQLWSEKFAKFVAWKLAENIAIPLAVDTKWHDRAVTMASHYEGEAWRINMKSEVEPVNPDAQYIAERQ